MSKLSSKTLADIASLARDITTAQAGRNADVHQDDSEKICGMYDELDGLAGSEAIRSMALEILHLRRLAQESSLRVEFQSEDWDRLRIFQDRVLRHK